MGVTLEFVSIDAVSPDVELAIQAEAIRRDDQPWVRCEPPHFFESGLGLLTGASKLNLFPASEDLPSTPLGSHDDIRELLRRLADWSQRYAISWNVSLMNHPIGSIRSGRCDDELFEAIESMASLPLNPQDSDDGLFTEL